MKKIEISMEPQLNPDFDFEGRKLLVFYYSKIYLDDIFKSKFSGKSWPIEKYDVVASFYKEYASVSFCPMIENFIDGIPFEVADRGIWKNGPGVQIFISLDDYSHLKTVFMR
jgi:hypothetical protein